jgi:preprotein translocase subunit SecE
MKKNRTKSKADPKGAPAESRGQVVRLKAARPKASWISKVKLPSVRGSWTTVKMFVVEAWQELRKVTWPNRKETLGTTGVVLILVVILALFLGMVDFSLSRLVRYFIR